MTSDRMIILLLLLLLTFLSVTCLSWEIYDGPNSFLNVAWVAARSIFSFTGARSSANLKTSGQYIFHEKNTLSLRLPWGSNQPGVPSDLLGEVKRNKTHTKWEANRGRCSVWRGRSTVRTSRGILQEHEYYSSWTNQIFESTISYTNSGYVGYYSIFKQIKYLTRNGGGPIGPPVVTSLQFVIGSQFLWNYTIIKFSISILFFFFQ